MRVKARESSFSSSQMSQAELNERYEPIPNVPTARRPISSPLANPSRNRTPFVVLVSGAAHQGKGRAGRFPARGSTLQDPPPRGARGNRPALGHHHASPMKDPFPPRSTRSRWDGRWWSSSHRTRCPLALEDRWQGLHDPSMSHDQ
jgi:hypothetical protein